MISLCFCYLCILCASHCSVNQPKPESVHLTALLNALQWFPCCPGDKVQTLSLAFKSASRSPDSVSNPVSCPSLFLHPPQADFLGLLVTITSVSLHMFTLPVHFMSMQMSLHPSTPEDCARGERWAWHRAQSV